MDIGPKRYGSSENRPEIREKYSKYLMEQNADSSEETEMIFDMNPMKSIDEKSKSTFLHRLRYELHYNDCRHFSDFLDKKLFNPNGATVIAIQP